MPPRPVTRAAPSATGSAGRVVNGLSHGAMALVSLLVFGTLLAVLWRAGGFSALGPADLSALRFTIVQALASAALSLAFAVPVARALARRRFRGRSALITLLGAPFILPVIVAVMGLVAIFGRAGLVNDVLGALGGAKLSIYGFHGVVLAHVFFNLPLAVRLLLQGWLAIPAERFRLAESLGFGSRDVLRHLEWPLLKALGPGIFLTIFLICLTSFAVALTLGGGPRATTVELAIYQAFRFDFDLGRASALATVQLVLCAGSAALAARFTIPAAFGAGLDRRITWPGSGGALPRISDAVWVGLAAAFLLVPLGAVVTAGIPGLWQLDQVVIGAAQRSLAVALAATALAIALALPMALSIGGAPRAPLREAMGMLPLATSSLVLGTGLYLLLRPFAGAGALALPVTVAVNAVMALPFCLRALIPAARSVTEDYGRLSDSLGITGIARLRLVTLPRLRRPLGFAAGLTAALAMGDLGVIALLADEDSTTLPLLIYRLMASYRNEAAAGAALLLLALSLGLFWLFDRGGRGDAPV